MAGKLIAKYEPGEIMVVASRTYSGNAASVFSSITGIKVFQGRFIPGILTNVSRADFVEPKLLIVCDPKGERQAVTEAGTMGIPIVGLCDSDNGTSFVDWVIPCNNKGRRSLALIFYLLAREYQMGKGRIASYDEFSTPLALFEAEPGEEAAAVAPAAAPAESVAAAVQGPSDAAHPEGHSPKAGGKKADEPAAEAAAPAEDAPAEKAEPAPAEKAEAATPKEEAAPAGEHAKKEHAHAHKKKEE